MSTARKFAYLDPEEESEWLVPTEPSASYSQTWPAWGMTQGGEAYELPTLVRRTSGSGSSCLPTPRSTDGAKGGPGQVNGRGKPDSLPAIAQLLPTPAARDFKGVDKPHRQGGQGLPSAIASL